MKRKPQDKRHSEPWLEVVVLLVLFVACASSGFVALVTIGPLAGLVGSIAGFLLYAWLGPPPMPGFVPGTLWMWMLGASFTAAIASVLSLLG